MDRSFRFNDSIINEGDEDFETSLALAYKSSVRPVCICRTPGLEMYIARLADGFCVKRMPGSGGKHHPDCESYELPKGLSGRGEISSRSIVNDDETGKIRLKLNFSLQKKAQALNSNLGDSKGDAESNVVATAAESKLTMRSLLHYLYEEAGLNKWSPKMEGKRSWYIVRKYLMEAMSNTIVKKLPLETVSYIPESFKLEKKDEQAVLRKKYLSSLDSISGPGKQQLGFIIGEFKEISESRHGYLIRVKHMPDMPLYANKGLVKQLNKNFGHYLATFEECSDVHLLLIAGVLPSASGAANVESISMMLVDKRWIPFDDYEEREVINYAVNSNRRFIKSLKYNLGKREIISNLVLTDLEEPVVVYVANVDTSEDEREKIDELMEDNEYKSCLVDMESTCSISLPSR